MHGSEMLSSAAHSRVTEIICTDQTHPVTAYISPAGITSQGVIRGVDTDFDDAALNRMLIQPRFIVPKYVYCGQVIYRCTLYKRQIDTCQAKWTTAKMCAPLLQPRYATSADTCQRTTHTCATNPCVPYAAKNTTRATGNAVVSAVTNESKPSSKQPPQDLARFPPRLPNPKDLS
ncbi:hypothetical protein HPB50_002388 [Hyalomma asiaticum]|uniref:Uncharacterized protein n=1 Tax=Hyalomma asiaticum TaxID=266040 RepID=A0ACB7TBD7_HYAAI|nr:hypothetical protein HPB50_002388 [Hyalomma asiaticum]